MNKIIGQWEGNSVKYNFKTDNTFDIIWKRSNSKSNGKYYFKDNKIFLEYGNNFFMKWNGTIEKLNETELYIRDNSNEIGKLDMFIKIILLSNESLNKENLSTFFYPIIKYPIEIKNTIESPLKEPNPIKKPNLYTPVKRKFKLEDLLLITVSPFVSLLFLIGGFKNEMYFISIIGVIFFIFTFHEIGKIINSEEIFNKKMKEYNSIMNPYNNKQNEILDYRNNISNEFWIFNKKKDIIFSIFNKSTIPTDTNKVQKIGKTENFFFNILKEKFGSKILNNLVIDLSVTGRAYIPDIIYADFNNKIFIDIEIDEPYSFEDKKPIHYIHNSVHIDEKRDKFFLENNWLVIRFSEIQVTKNFLECIKTLELIIKGIEEQYIVDKETLLKNNIRTHSCWSYSGAKKMAVDNFREKYI